MLAVGFGLSEEIGQPLREPTQVRVPRGPCRNVGAAHFLEDLIAEINVQKLVIALQNLDQARRIGMAVHAEKNLALLLDAVEDLAQNPIVAVDDGSLNVRLQAREVVHACRRAPTMEGRTRAAMSRACCISATNSSSGGMLSSRSIMVDTGPKRFSAAS